MSASRNVPSAPAPPRSSAALLDGGPEAFPRMLAAIESAQRSIHLEIYAFARDETGGRFLAALGEAARRGIQVAVTIDGWGSALDGRYVAGVLREAGCQVTLYNPLVALLVGRFRRNHRKLLLVDGEVAFIGGMNIGDEAGRVGTAEEKRWEDLAVELRGPACTWLARRLRGERPPQPPGPVRIYLSGVGGGRRLRHRYIKALGAARRSVTVAHAYFIPDRRLVRSITAAARRGVDVTLVLAGRSDVPWARPAAMRLYGQLLRAGVRVYEWRASVLHAKAAVADGSRLLVGSFNLDPFSLRNLETLVELDDPEVAAAGQAWMQRLIARARPVTLEEVQARSPFQRWVLDVLGLLAVRGAHGIARLLALR